MGEVRLFSFEKVPPLEVLRKLMNGYETTQVYRATRFSSVGSLPTSVSLFLALEELPTPKFVLHDSYLSEEDVERYTSYLADGLCVGAKSSSSSGSEELVGFLFANFSTWNKTIHVWELQVARSVEPNWNHVSTALMSLNCRSHRGNNIGRKMMTWLEENAVNRFPSARALVCETQSINVPAISFYLKTGFTFDGIDISVRTEFRTLSLVASLTSGKQFYENDDIEKDNVAIFMKKRLSPPSTAAVAK